MWVIFEHRLIGRWRIDEALDLIKSMVGFKRLGTNKKTLREYQAICSTERGNVNARILG